MREQLEEKPLRLVASLELFLTNLIYELVESDTEYHQAYQTIKDRAQAFATFAGKVETQALPTQTTTNQLPTNKRGH